ncbi:MAG: T9SS type A sorting domain-containing protein, partial [Bacteroidales bacterium]|nr:T9SS type A sorting domain-containing protein [Bacteroidales bacterium]
NNSGAETSEGWRIKIDGEEVAFDADQVFYYGQDIKAWYYASNACGEVASDTLVLVIKQQPYAEDITALEGAVCAGQPLTIVPPVTHEFGGDIVQGWEYTRAYGSSFYTALPSDTIIDYGMNGVFVRYYITNECSTDVYHTNSVQIFVNDVPTVGAIVSNGSTYCSGAAFDVAEPEHLSDNGSAVTGSGWYLSADSAFASSRDLTEVDVTNGIDADLWYGQWLRYADTNACGVGYSNAVQIAVYPAFHLTVSPAEDTACFGPIYTFEASSDIDGATYAWTGDGLLATTGASVNADPSAPGLQVYTVVARETEHGCTATAQATVMLNLISKDTSVHICASDLNYVFDEVEYPDQVCTQAGYYSYVYTTADGCDSVVNLHLTVTKPIERNTRLHYCNYSPAYVWPVTGEVLGGPSVKDTVIERQYVIPCENAISDIDGHHCDSIVYKLEFEISNEPYLDIPVTDITLPVGQEATAEFNVRKDCDFPTVKMAVAYNLYRNDTLVDVVSDYGNMDIQTYAPMVDQYFGSNVIIGTGEVPGSTYSMYNYDYDYFYADYFCTVDNHVTATWNEPGEYRLELVVVRKATDRGMDYAYTDDNNRVMGGGGSWPTDSIFSDTVTIFFHVGAVDTMPVQELTFCESELPQYLYDVQLTETGYYEAFVGENGNFQLYPANVTINPTLYDTVSVVMNRNCSQTYAWNGTTYSTSGTFDYTTTSAVTGCDSIVTLEMVFVNDGYTIFTENVTSCGSYTWTQDGNTYDVSGTYDDTTTFNDCEAIYRINLTVNEPYDTTINVVVAETQLPYVYDANNTFDAAGAYDVVYTRINGCDSVLHVNLTVSNSGFDFDTTQFAEELGDTSMFDVTLIGGELSNRKVAIDYEITRNGEIIDNIADYGTVNFATEYADIHQFVGRDLINGVGSIPASTFRIIYYQYTYWYLDFLNQAASRLTAQWNVPGEYKIKFYLREREGGEDYALTYNGGAGLVGGGGSTTLVGDLAVDSVVMRYETNPVFMDENFVVCSDELPFYYRGEEFTEATNEPLTIEFGDEYHIYDTVVTLTLTVNPAYHIYDTAYICAQDSYADANFDLTADDIALTAAGSDMAVFTLNGTTMTGCDSTVTLTLFISPLPNVQAATRTPNVCEGTEIELSVVGADSYEWSDVSLAGTTPSYIVNEGVTLSVTGTNTYVVGNGDLLSCSATDSVVLNVMPLGRTDEYTGVVCQGEPYIDSIFYVEAAKTAVTGIVDTTVEVSRSDCGIILAHLMLTVHPAYNEVNGYREFTDEVCEGYDYDNYGFSVSADSIEALRYAAATFVNDDIVLYNIAETSFGCDSITKLTLHINRAVSSDTTIHFCTPESWPYLYQENGQSFELTAVETVVVRYAQEATGCDSLRYVTVVFDPMPTFAVSGTEVCANMTETELSLNIEGADSIRWTLDGSVIGTDNVQTIDADDFTNTLTVSVYAGACVNTQTVAITTIENPMVTIDTAICQNATYVAPNGTSYNVADTYEWFEASTDGCDIHYILNLTVNPTYTTSEELTIRAAELPYIWNGLVFDGVGTQTAYLTTVNGCDSVVTLTLNVTDTLGGAPFLTTERVDDNSFILKAFANTMDPSSKASINYTLYKLDPVTNQNVVVGGIATTCGGLLNISTACNGTYYGRTQVNGVGNVPATTLAFGTSVYDYLYFYFLNGRENRVTYDFEEPGTYTIVFELMEETDGIDQAYVYTENGLTRRFGGRNSIEGATALAMCSYTFTVETSEDEYISSLPTLELSDNDITEASSSVTLTCNANDYPSDRKVAVRYTIYRDGQLLSNVVNAANIRMSTYLQLTGNNVGSAVTANTGFIPGNTFRPSPSYPYNYFYMNFLGNTTNTITADWRQMGNYSIVFDLVEMEGGSDLALMWNGTDRIGGKNAVATSTILATTTLNYEVGSVAAPMGIDETAAGENELAIYPNPANAKVQCSLPNAQLDGDITVTDMNGKVVKRIAAEEVVNGVVTFNVSTWSAGVYFVNVRDNDTVITKKLVVTK